MNHAPLLSRFDNFFTKIWLGGSAFQHSLPLLEMTITHKSFSADSPQEQIPHNERMEFLGDALLGAIIAEQVYHDYPTLPESELTLKKIFLVKEPTLANAAREIDLWSQLRLSNGEEKSGGREKDAVLADAYEALIAYLWLQFDPSVATACIMKTLYPFLDDQEAHHGKSFKSLLQEWIQKQHQQLPIYIEEEIEIESSGNVLTYSSNVYLGDKLLWSWTGSNKKKAQEEAAKEAYEKLMD